MTNDAANMTFVSPITLLDDVRTAVNDYLTSYFLAKQQSAVTISPQYGRLWQAMMDLNQSGGKRFRPYMVMLAYDSFGGNKTEDILPVAAAWELLHLCLLIHDDIIDNDLIRYGVKNIAGRYENIYDTPGLSPERKAHLAASAALLAGDLLLSAAHELVIDSSLSSKQKLAIQSYIVGATYAVAGGELLDTEAVLYPLSDADTFAIAKYKSAIYTFVGPLSSGALLAGASRKVLAAIEELGTNLGYAFQLADDVLGMFGDTSITGKSTLGDLNEGKRTFLLQKTFELASEQDRAILGSIVGSGKVTENEATQVRRIMERSGAKAETDAAISRYAHVSRTIVEKFDISPHHKQELFKLVAAVTVRQS